MSSNLHFVLCCRKLDAASDTALGASNQVGVLTHSLYCVIVGVCDVTITL